MLLLCEKHGMCTKEGVWRGAGSHLSLRLVPTESPNLHLLYLTKLLGMVLLPTKELQEIQQEFTSHISPVFQVKFVFFVFVLFLVI